MARMMRSLMAIAALTGALVLGAAAGAQASFAGPVATGTSQEIVRRPRT